MGSGKRKRLGLLEYVAGIQDGDRAILGRAITLMESRLESDRELAAEVLESVLPHTGTSVRIGITGAPGVGKSTFIDAFGTYLIQAGHRVAVLAVDPTSTVSKGSILGDKTRMDSLAHDPNAFVRPSPSKGLLGGVGAATRESSLLCEAAGYTHILIETVGVGQSEVAVAQMVDIFILLVQPGLGDELQGIKKGIMENSDLVIVNKADGAGVSQAKATKQDFERALHYFPAKPSGWIPKVLCTSSLQKTGLGEIVGEIDSFIATIKANGFFDRQRKEQRAHWLMEQVDQMLRDRFFGHPRVKSELLSLQDEVSQGRVSSLRGAQKLIDIVFKKE